VIHPFGIEDWQCVEAADGNTWLKFETGFELTCEDPTGAQCWGLLEEKVEEIYLGTSVSVCRDIESVLGLGKGRESVVWSCVEMRWNEGDVVKRCMVLCLLLLIGIIEVLYLSFQCL